MRVAAVCIAVMVVALVYGVAVRGALDSHEIVHDGPALIAYVVAAIAAVVGGRALGRALR